MDTTMGVSDIPIDLVLIDIQTMDVYEFTLRTSKSVLYIPISSYFPFTSDASRFIQSMSDDEYVVGVGYPRRTNGNLIEDVQVGISGGVRRHENDRSAAIRETAEETGLNFDTMDEIYQTSWSSGGKEWSSYYMSISNQSTLVESLEEVDAASCKRGVSMMIKGRYNQLMQMYKNIQHADCYPCLKDNMDHIRFIALMSKEMLDTINLKYEHTMWYNRESVPLSLVRFNNASELTSDGAKSLFLAKGCREPARKKSRKQRPVTTRFVKL